MSEQKQSVLMIAATPFFADRGCHIRIYEEIVQLQKKGVSVHLCTYSLGEDVPGVSTTRTLRVPWYTNTNPGASFHKMYIDVLLFFSTLKKYIVEKPKVLHVHQYEALYIAFFVKIFTLSRVPIVFDCQGSLAHEMYQYHLKKNILAKPFYILFFLLEKIALYLPNHIICSSRHSANTLQKEFHVSSEKITEVYDGFLNNRSTVSEEQTKQLRKELGVPEGNKVIVYSGSLSIAKGVQEYLDAVPELLTKLPYTTFLFIGYGPLEELYRQKYSSYIREKKIIFTGRISYFSLPKYLSLADYAVDPKKNSTESSGKIIHYLMAGIPTFGFSAPFNSLTHFIYTIQSFSDIPGLVNNNIPAKSLTQDIVHQYSNEHEASKIIHIYELVQKQRRISFAVHFIGVTLISIICALLFKRFSSVGNVVQGVQRISFPFLMYSFIAYFCVFLLRSYRYSVISPVKKIKDNYIVSGIHVFINNILPAELGEAAYPILLKKLHQVDYTKSISDLTLIRIFDLLNVVVLIITAGLSIVFQSNIVVLVGIILVAQISIVIGFTLFIRYLSRLVSYFKPSENILGKTVQGINSILAHQTKHSMLTLLRLHVLSLVVVCGMIIYSIFTMKALGLSVPFAYFIVGWGLSLIGSVIPLQGFFGFGSIEAGWILPITSAGVLFEQAVTYSINYHLINLFFSAIVFVTSLCLLAYKSLQNRHSREENTLQ